jgi:hypothetical protein
LIKNDKGEFCPQGTGFFIGLKQKSTAIYFVTAKHVLLSSSNNFFPEIYIRISRKDSNLEHIKVNLTDSLLTHPKDENVDIVLYPFSPSTEVYDYLYIPAANLLATKERQIKKWLKAIKYFMQDFLEIIG